MTVSQTLKSRISKSLIVHCSLSIAPLFIVLWPALRPLFTADFTCGYDNTFHLWRAVEIENLLRQGVLFSRWAPNMAHGYGYPLFNFAAPASAYGVALLHLLGMSWPWALNLAFAAGWVLAACTMYIFVHDLFGRYAGMVAATLYTYAPFHAYDVFYRGGLSQSSAWLFPPLILWALRRARSRVGFAVAALGFAGLILTHNAFALLFAPILLAYTFVVWQQQGKKAALCGNVALLTGLGLSTFFWVPALVELDFVHSERLSGAWVFRYTENFLPLEQLFPPPRTADPALINDWPARGLGLIPVLLAAIGLFAALRNRQHRLMVVLFAAALVLYLFLTLPVSRPVWDVIPLLQRVQFPWRLVGPATLCAAVLAGAILTTNQQTTRSSTIAAGLVLLLILGHLGWFYPRHCPPLQDISIAGMIDWENATDTVGTTAKGEYLPTWVRSMPADDATGQSIARLPSESLPKGTQLLRADYGPTDATIELETPVSFQARYLAFYYPGWRVTVDGDTVPVVPTEPDGLISFAAPAGRHTIQVHFGETPLRLAADILSILSLVALIIMVLKLKPQSNHSLTHPPIVHSSLPHCSFFIAPLLIVSLFIVPLIPRRSNLMGSSLRHVDVPTEIAFGDEFVLLGHDALPECVASGGEIEIKTYWRALHPGGPDYGVTINVVDTQPENGGYRWNSSAIRPPRWHRTPPPVWEWQPDQYVTVELVVPILPGTPPGTYTIEAVAFDRDTLAPLTAHDVNAQALGPALPLGQITIVAPRSPADPNALNMRRLDVPLGPLTLLGADFDRNQAAPGDPIHLTTLWRVERRPPQVPDLTVHLTLLAPDGSPAAEFDLPPTTAQHPTSAWQPGQVWRGQHIIHLPANLGDGDHTWRLDLRPIASSTALPALFTVTAPDHTFTPPPVSLTTNIRLGDVATLVGATVTPGSLAPGDTITVTLVWRVEAETRTSYRVFLHLLDPSGKLIAQSDSVPANWTRPTTGWLPGEYVTDAHTFAIPPGAPGGDYVLFTGLYVPDDGRLTTPDGEDAILLTTIAVEAQ